MRTDTQTPSGELSLLLKESSDPRLWARAMPAGLAWYATRQKWLAADHLLTLNERLMAVAAGEAKRLIVQMPPRHGKSTLISHYFPAWWIGRFHQPVILASYEADFAAHWGGKARDVIGEYGESLFGVGVKKDKASASWWESTGGGSMMTAGVGGPITGKGASLLIVDDPVKNAEEAASETYRAKAWDWWMSTAYTRLEPAGAVVIVMTRWHEDDLVGRILQEMKEGGEEWEVLNLPALTDGRALWPERYDTDALANIQRSIGSYFWQALYMGSPVGEAGHLFQRGWWQMYERLPENLHRGCVAVDMGHSVSGDADYTVAAVWRSDGQRHFLDTVIRGRFEAPYRLRMLKDLRAEYRLPLLVEAALDSRDLVELLQREVGGVIPCPPAGKSKQARAEAIMHMVEEGRVYLRSGAPWVDEFIDEHLAFPLGAHDDQVDTTSMALLYLGRQPSVRKDKPKGRSFRSRWEVTA